jgi:uncharacterized protein (DUF433 family)
VELKMAEWEDRISLNPEVLAGKPVIRNTRLAVEFILDLLGNGVSIEEILENYPKITREDVLACVSYASDILHDLRIFPLKAS